MIRIGKAAQPRIEQKKQWVEEEKNRLVKEIDESAVEENSSTDSQAKRP
jgi:hypothetical protein